MNILIDDLPTTIDGIEVYTDFRDIIEINIAVMKGDDKKMNRLIIDLIKDRATQFELINDEERLLSFYKGFIQFVINSKDDEEKSLKSNKKRKKRANKCVLSYEDDADYILGAFLECYGIDLREIKYLHYYKFLALLNALNEDTELKKRMMYRSIDASKIKDKNEKQRILKIQKSIAIKAEELSDEEIADAFS